MTDFRKYIIIIVIAILFAVLFFSTIEAVYLEPEYDKFCVTRGTSYGQNCTPVIVPQSESDACFLHHGYMMADYDEQGCEIAYHCDTCNYSYQQALQRYENYRFYLSIIFALIAIFVGLYLPAKTNTLNEWVGTGFMLGGTFVLFYVTVKSFESLNRIVRPIVILFELILIIYISYRKVGNLRQDTYSRKKR